MKPLAETIYHCDIITDQ